MLGRDMLASMILRRVSHSATLSRANAGHLCRFQGDNFAICNQSVARRGGLEPPIVRKAVGVLDNFRPRGRTVPGGAGAAGGRVSVDPGIARDLPGNTVLPVPVTRPALELSAAVSRQPGARQSAPGPSRDGTVAGS